MDETQARELGKYIRKAREEAGLGIRPLAFSVGVDQAQIVRLENGQVASPKADVLGQIAQALDVPIADLFGLAGYPLVRSLPTLRPYLRNKYSNLSPNALAEIEAIVARDLNLGAFAGPVDGEDEREPSSRPRRAPSN